MLESKIREIEAEIRKEMKTLSVVLGDIDGKVNDILHFIEFEKYSASEGAKLLKQLKSLRQERRDVKWFMLQNLKSVTVCYKNQEAINNQITNRHD